MREVTAPTRATTTNLHAGYQGRTEDALTPLCIRHRGEACVFTMSAPLWRPRCAGPLARSDGLEIEIEHVIRARSIPKDLGFAATVLGLVTERGCTSVEASKVRDCRHDPAAALWNAPGLLPAPLPEPAPPVGSHCWKQSR